MIPMLVVIEEPTADVMAEKAASDEVALNIFFGLRIISGEGAGALPTPFRP